MLENIKLIVSILPYILSLVKVVEEGLPDAGKGKEKLAFVRDALTTIIPEISNLWPILEKIISSVVTLYNNTGIFKKS